ncbi:unnamed protein product, partial [marine sediment metagenome]
PDISEISLSLFDDGFSIHGDNVANDGIYTNLLTEFNEDGSYTVEITALGHNSLSEPFSRQDFKTVLVSGVPTDTMPPATTLLIGPPQYIDSLGLTYITSSTLITLSAVDNHGVGSGVALTKYKIYNSEYDSGWFDVISPASFHLLGLEDGEYDIDYYSIDNVGNIESVNTQSVYLDNCAPELIIETPYPDEGLQDGVTFSAIALDASAVDTVKFSIYCAEGNIFGPEYEKLPAQLNSEGKWVLYFDTTSLDDGLYIFEVEGTDVLGNVGYQSVPFSIQNWAVLELLPSTLNSKAGRTMPIKFSIRIVESVNPDQLFVRNEELTVKIYAIRKGIKEL